MRVIVGLGNPGASYQNTRHNIGFTVLDYLKNHYHCPSFAQKENLLLSKTAIKGQDFVLCKPVSFMNLSGLALVPLIKFYKIPTEHILVIHDDIDLKPFEIRTKQGGGHGGHNGLRNIDQYLGKTYHRIRIGVGHPGHKDDVSDYVLSNFSKEEEAELPFVFKNILDKIELTLI